MTEPVDVLAFGAHPDDVEIGCGGALILAAGAGLRVAAADLTRGELATRGSVDERERERTAAARILGLCERVSLGLPDTRLGTDPGHRDAIVSLLRAWTPWIVLAPYAEDRHPDHAACGRLVREACFLAGVRKAGTGAPHHPRRLYEYMTHQPFEPSFVVDISVVWDRRSSAVSAYRSQFGVADAPLTQIGSPRFLELLETRASFYGAMIGAARGEPFYCRGPLAMTMLPEQDGGRNRAPLPIYRPFL